MGEYDFERLTRYRKIDILVKALEDDNEHQRFKAVESLEAIAHGSLANSEAQTILREVSAQNPYDDVRQHAQIALKNLESSHKELVERATEANKLNAKNAKVSKKERTSKPLDSAHYSKRVIVVCELDDDCTLLVVHGDTRILHHKLKSIKGGRWDRSAKVWRFPIERSTIEGLKKIGVMLHPTIQSLYTSPEDTWAVKTRNKKWIKIIGPTDSIADNLKKVASCEWDQENKAWKVPFNAESIKRLMKIDGLYVSPFILD